MNMYVVCELPAIVSTNVDWELYVFVDSGAMSVPPDQGPARLVAQKTLSGFGRYPVLEDTMRKYTPRGNSTSMTRAN